ncbi:glycosyltransferase [Elizabethkingia anophelis]|uniref:glycosyltransferase n=1 Tax=Elizabethkingia anophelis TaxID=1117645 RepID=UPI003F1A19C2
MYDLTILNNCPSFYKINLYNEISLKKKIFVIFLGYSEHVVIDDEFDKHINFDYIVLNKFQLEKRSFFTTFFKILQILKKVRSKKIIYGGYIEKEFLLLSFINRKSKNILQSESAGESVVTGWKRYIKKILLSRYDKAIVSGKRHQKVLTDLNFKGNIFISKGVGILRKERNNERLSKTEIINNNSGLRFLFVGRIIKLKNVDLLIDVFNELGLSLTIVGDGIERKELESKSKSNIIFKGYCSNEEIHKYYKDADVFILPSYSEAWGLVVEEALYYNCALLLSEDVGSLSELLLDPKTGISFNPHSKESLKKSIMKVIENYNYYKANAIEFDIDNKDREQIQSYLNLLND